MTNLWDAYERISDDSTDERGGVTRQRADTEAAVSARGGTVERHHEENDTSAYKRRQVELSDPNGNAYIGLRVIRPVWTEALRRLRSGEATRLMVYDLDRLARDPRDLEDAIEVVEQYGAEIRSATASEIDLSTESGRFNARLLVLIANKSSADTSRRVKRKKEDNRAKGIRQPGRYRTYGYARDWTVIKDEAAVIVEAFERRAKGESITAIAKDLTARGLLNVNGMPWNAGNLGKLLSKCDYAGLIDYKGEIVAKAAFEPIISEALFYQVRDNLASVSVKGRGARSHLLSGFLICSKCLTGMKGNGSANHYRCPSPADVSTACGSCTAKMDVTDDVVLDAVTVHTTDYEVSNEPVSTRDFDSEIAEIDSKIADLRASVSAGVLELEDFTALVKVQRDRKSVLTKEQASVIVSADLGHLQIVADWNTLNLSQRRVWLATWLKHVLVHPPTRNNRFGFDPSRLELFYTDGTSERLDDSWLPVFSNEEKED